MLCFRQVFSLTTSTFYLKYDKIKIYLYCNSYYYNSSHILFQLEFAFTYILQPKYSFNFFSIPFFFWLTFFCLYFSCLFTELLAELRHCYPFPMDGTNRQFWEHFFFCVVRSVSSLSMNVSGRRKVCYAVVLFLSAGMYI